MTDIIESRDDRHINSDAPWPDFIEEIFRYCDRTDGLIEFRACPNNRSGGAPQEWSGKEGALTAFFEKWDKPGWGLYFGVGTRSGRRGADKDVRELPCLWVDVDKIAKALVLAAIKKCRYPPTIVVDSGRGLHLYWLLNQPEEPSEAFLECLRGLCRIFAGYPVVCNFSRIMRLPGSTNSKYASPLPVRVVTADWARTYSFDDLLEMARDDVTVLGAAANPFLEGLQTVDLEAMTDGTVHSTQRDWIWRALRGTQSHEEIFQAVMRATQAFADRTGKKWDWKKEERDLRKMIRASRAKIDAEETAQVHDMNEERRKRGQPEVDLSGAKHKVVKVGMYALADWGAAPITVGGVFWTYADGVWIRFTPELEHSLKTYIQKAVRDLGMPPTAATLNGAYRWIFENPDLVRDAAWDRAGVIVGNNGALVIATGVVVGNQPEHYATWKVDCDLDAAATCPQWLEFLGGSMPNEVTPSLQEWMGAALIRGKSREMSKGLIIHGPSRTGKTVVTEVVRATLGGRTCGLRVKDLAKERFGREPLLGASGWIADDAVGMREVLDAEGYKQIVTGERTSVRRMYIGAVDVAFDLPVLLTMNNLPVVRDDSDAVYNRSAVIPMTRVWPEDEAIPLLGQAIVREELAGVLRWALVGLRRLQERGRFEFPEIMRLAGQEFKGMNNPLDGFLEQCVVEDPKSYVHKTDLTRLYNNWARVEIGHDKPMAAEVLGPSIRKNGRYRIEETKIHPGRRIWVGIAFIEPVLDYEERDPMGQLKYKLEHLNHRVTADVREAMARGAK